MMTRTTYRIATTHPAPEFRLRDHLIEAAENDGVVCFTSPGLGCSRDYQCGLNKAINIFLAEHGMSLVDMQLADAAPNKGERA